MWASKTCYSKLHGTDCLRKSQYAVSINGTAFAKHFLNFCHDKQISALVDKRNRNFGDDYYRTGEITVSNSQIMIPRCYSKAGKWHYREDFIYLIMAM